MRNSNHNLLKLMTFADYFDSVFEQVSAAVTKKPSGRITIELTEYVLYCLQLLENNGYPPAAYADEIQTFMWQACPAVALQILGYPNSAGRWKIERETAYLEIELDCR